MLFKITLFWFLCYSSTRQVRISETLFCWTWSISEATVLNATDDPTPSIKLYKSIYVYILMYIFKRMVHANQNGLPEDLEQPPLRDPNKQKHLQPLHLHDPSVITKMSPSSVDIFIIFIFIFLLFFIIFSLKKICIVLNLYIIN